MLCGVLVFECVMGCCLLRCLMRFIGVMFVLFVVFLSVRLVRFRFLCFGKCWGSCELCPVCPC